MSWACELSRDAEQDLRGLPQPIQKRVARVLTRPIPRQRESPPREEWKGILRRPIGDYRLLFTADRNKQIVSVLRILIRSGKTYR